MSMRVSLSDQNRALWVEFLTGWFQAQTRRSAFYLMLGLPLGIIYFTFLVTGFSTGTGLIVIYAGLPVLFLTLAGARLFTNLETTLANELQGANIVQPPAPWMGGGSLWSRTKRTLTDAPTWKGIFFLFAMFPIGIATFTITVVLVSVSFWSATVLIWGPFVDWHGWDPGWQARAILEGIVFVGGVLLVLATPHILNLMAAARSGFASQMLSYPDRAAAHAARAGVNEVAPKVRKERSDRYHALATKSFNIHAALFVAVNALILLVDLLTPGGPWFYWSLIGWGTALAAHRAILYVLFLGGGRDAKYTQRMLQEE